MMVFVLVVVALVVMALVGMVTYADLTDQSWKPTGSTPARRAARAALLQRELGATPDTGFSEDSYDIRSGNVLCSFSLDDEPKVQLHFGRADGTTPFDHLERTDEDVERRPQPGAEWNVETDGSALVPDAETDQDPELIAIFAPHLERLARGGITYLGCYFEMLECDLAAPTEAELIVRIRALLVPLCDLYERMDRRYVAFADAELERVASRPVAS